MKIFKTQFEGYCGPCAVHEMESVLEELRQAMPEMGEGDVFTITVVEMDEKEYNNLPEFQGY